MMFQLFEKRFQIIVGGRHIRNPIAGEESPPAMAHRFDNLGDDLGFIRSLSGLLRQMFQELSDRPFHLAHRSSLTLVIVGFETTV